jgi:hypothetical protein
MCLELAVADKHVEFGRVNTFGLRLEWEQNWLCVEEGCVAHGLKWELFACGFRIISFNDEIRYCDYVASVIDELMGTGELVEWQWQGKTYPIATLSTTYPT